LAKILTYPDHTLLQISGLIRDFDDPNLPKIIDELIATAKEHDLPGLAAIQIGVPLRIIVMKRDGEWITLINPALFAKEGKSFPSTEEDESIPGAKLTVPRFPKIKVMYETPQKETKFLEAEGEEAIWLQRKIDMVFGGYLFDKLGKKERKKFFKEFGDYGDTCPTYFVKDRILAGLRLTLTLHFIALLVALFGGFEFVLRHAFSLFGLELAWLILYFFYARYETKKYKNCTSCQNANIIGTAGIYFAVMTLLLIAALIIRTIR